MRKRPLFTAACLFALFIWFLISVLHVDLFRLPFSEGEKLILQGRLLKTEQKGEQIYCYLQRASFEWDESAAQRASIERDESRGQKAAGEQSESAVQREEKAVRLQKVILIADGDQEVIRALKPGNQIKAEVTYEAFRNARNQGNYDEEQYYHSLGVSAKFRLRGSVTVQSSRIFLLRCAMQWVKGRLSAALHSVLADTGAEEEGRGTQGEASFESGRSSSALSSSSYTLSHSANESGNNHADIFLAILTGDRSGLDADTKDLYRKSGIAHILAISGLHISFIGMSLFAMLRKRMRFSFAAVISAAVMICFCIMSGESASALRATIMFLLRLLAMKFGKTFDLLSALGLAGILILVQNPMYLYHSGFQLSFGAILGIGMLAPRLRKNFGTMRKRDGGKEGDGAAAAPPSTFHRKTAETLIKRAKDAFLISLSVTLITLPIIINSYYEIPVFSVLLNLLVVPMMGLVLESGAFGVLLGIFSVFLGRMLIGAGVYMVSFIELLCAVSDRIPFSILITGHISGIRIALYYGALLSIIFAGPVRKRLMGHRPGKSAAASAAGSFLKRKGTAITKTLETMNKTRFLWRAATVLCAAALLAGIIFIRPAAKQLQITFFDVDQGDGILIESPSGAVYLIDGGSTSVSELYRYRLESALKYKGITHIDYAVVTHTDTDHISGVLSMLEEDGAGSISIQNLALPMIPENTNYEALTAAAEAKGVRVHTLHEGMILKDPDVSFTCLYPPVGFHGPDSNSYSAVLSMTYGSFRALFTGDLDETGENYLVTKRSLIDCDLLKVAHHGSRFSSGRRFLEEAAPEIAVVSAGVRNSYGHPHKEVLERLDAVDADVYVTAENGQIRVQVDASGRAEVLPLFS